jgi:hypothetical protein
LKIAREILWQIVGKRRLQLESAGIRKLQHSEGEDRFAQRRRLEHGMLVDGGRRWREANAPAQIPVEFAVADDSCGDAGNLTRNHESH